MYLRRLYMPEATMTSHVMPTNSILFDKNDAELLIVSPPRSGSGFLLENLRAALERLDGSDIQRTGEDSSAYNKIVCTRYVSELDATKNTISIIRKPSDWITSLVAARLFLEGRTDMSAVIDEEIAAASVALVEYNSFASDKIVFVKFEDVVFRFFRTARKIAEVFGYQTVEPFGSVKLAKDSPLSPATSTKFPNYIAIANELKTRDLSTVNGLYEDLLAKTLQV
jgi:hypothetical protein